MFEEIYFGSFFMFIFDAILPSFLFAYINVAKISRYDVDELVHGPGQYL